MVISSTEATYNNSDKPCISAIANYYVIFYNFSNSLVILSFSITTFFNFFLNLNVSSSLIYIYLTYSYAT